MWCDNCVASFNLLTHCMLMIGTLMIAALMTVPTTRHILLNKSIVKNTFSKRIVVMFSLLYGFWQFLFRRDEFFILILGLDNAGKTTFLEQAQMQFVRGYKAKALDKITTTVGLNIGKIDTSSIRLMFWDLGGQEELQALWDKYYAESHGLIYVVDSSDPARLEESRIAFEQMLESEALMGVPLLVLANKQDVEGHLPSDEVKKEFNKTAKLMGHRACRLQPVSALTGEGVHEGIAWLVDSVKHNAPWRPPREPEIH